ncbi:TetR/AcrR family transcriptional regulator [Clostridium aminobutyricum]|uniref:TetR/AcrR family transcriptional regulator n=1 Tax=Clostridium aminobutyricum TaxID=33953 RepID=A0A939D5Q8_CLOAM|nr:TetR/AcrR family transcriptional regulator [Clostridium aminobutyricum]MBN7771804.1 TetR/AcrR family transcriptional regulator [Clostridium aminobutyricum]
MIQDIHPTKFAIMQAAVEVFGQKGFSGATTKEIAQIANISEGTIFRHFPNKTEILYEVVNQVVPLIGVESLQKAVADSADMDARTALRYILQDRFENINKLKTFIRIILTEIQYDERLRDIYVNRVYNPISQILKTFFLERMEQGEFKKKSPELFLNMIFSYVLFSIVNPELLKNLNQQSFFDQNAADELADLLLDGIKGGSNE